LPACADHPSGKPPESALPLCMAVRVPPFGFPRECKPGFHRPEGLPPKGSKTPHRSPFDSAVSPFRHGFFSRSPRRAANPYSIDSRGLNLSRRAEFFGFNRSALGFLFVTPNEHPEGPGRWLGAVCSIALGSLVRFQCAGGQLPRATFWVEFLGTKVRFRTSLKSSFFRSA